ncbi:MAG: hypothetical protein LBF38_01720, partial [Deltaproteobacteria bacterium]|nr:hypothetical protein [Deltaproteobacteria bacterium]
MLYVFKINFKALPALMVFLLCLPPSLALAENIDYPGTGLITVNGNLGSLAPSGSESGKSNSLSDNTVTVSEGPDIKNVYGAVNVSDDESIDNNQVIVIAPDSMRISIVYGGYGQNASVNDSNVTIKGVTVGQIIGGFSYRDDVLRNNVVIEAGTKVTGKVYGGYSNFGNVSYNSVIFYAAGNSQEIIGGWSGSGKVSYNNVIIDGAASLQGVLGGLTDVGAVSYNNVSIGGGAIVDYVYGGESKDGFVGYNTVYIGGGAKVKYEVFGGLSRQNDANYNTVIVNGQATVEMEIYGGSSQDGGGANHNTVIIDGWATVKFAIAGGWSRYSNSNYNNVWIGDVDFTDNGDKQILGGFSW